MVINSGNQKCKKDTRYFPAGNNVNAWTANTNSIWSDLKFSGNISSDNVSILENEDKLCIISDFLARLGLESSSGDF